MSCTDLEREFVILIKQGVKNPDSCQGGGCSQRKIEGICPCNLVVYNIRPHTFELIGAIWPFFEMVAISNLGFKEVQQIVDHLERILNLPIIEKNRRTI